jgi:hypothetical protein
MSTRCLLILLLALNTVAQTPFVRDGSIGQPPLKSESESKQFGTLEIKDWVGQRFILLPQSKKSQSYGYQAFSPALPYDKWVGKTLTVVEVTTKTITKEVILRAADGKTLRAKAYGDSIHSIAPLRDLEYARSNWLGKTLWIRDSGGLVSWNESTQEFGSVMTKRFSALVVMDVVASFNNDAPIRLILKTTKEEVGFRDVNATGTNIDMRLRKHRRYADVFFERDPQTIRNWPPEIWSAIEEGRVVIGMTPEEARMSWGNPKSVNRTVTALGVDEQWVYNDLTFIYFRDGKVTAVQN